MISIVIPCYRESRRLPATIERLSSFLRETNIDHEVILVIEPSPDNTLQIAQESVAQNPSWRLIEHEKRLGKGGAVRTGVLTAKGEIVFYMDADLSTSLEEIPRFIEAFEEDPQIVLLAADRTMGDSVIKPRQPFHRRFLGDRLRSITQRLFKLPIVDTQCGFKAIRNPQAQELFSQLTLETFAFDIELLLLARRHKYLMEPMPVFWTNAPHSTLFWPRDGLRLLWDTLRLYQKYGPQ